MTGLYFLAATLLLGGLAAAQESQRVVELPTFTVIGIQCRTENAREASGKGCIGQQWERLFGEGILDKIPGKLDKSIIAVYTDYADDKDGEYTYVLGAKVKPETVAPEGMAKVTVGGGRFALFTSDKGPVTQVVPGTWKRIWETPKSQPGGDRVYRSDFEVYDQRAVDPQNSQVDVYIRIR